MGRARLALVLALALALGACGGGTDSPTGPSATQIPEVAGNYNGTTTIAFPELRLTVTCRTTTSVNQASGGRVSIAPLVMSPGAPECSGLSVPVGDATIDAAGSLGMGTGSYFDPSCRGTYSYTASGGFFSRSLRASLTYTSTVCYNFTVTIDVQR